MNVQTSDNEREQPNLLTVMTLVTWLSCVAVGMSGFLLRYPRPQLAALPVAQSPAELMHVELSRDSSASPDVGSPLPPPPVSSVPEPPEKPRAALPPAAPQLTSVAVPSPSIDFAVPVEGPSQTVAPKDAAPARPAPGEAATQSPQPSAAAAPAAQRLVYGEGEGRQPAPTYPPQAVRSHQQGTVVVRFTVDADGRVTSAQAVTPCPYPLLNQAAVHVVRADWRFRAGDARSFEVSIEFQLKQR